MTPYIPKGKALKAMQYLEEEGAQFAKELHAHIDVLSTDLRRTLEAAVRHRLVDFEYRIRVGSKAQMLWHLTPAGVEMLEKLRQVEGAVV